MNEKEARKRANELEPDCYYSQGYLEAIEKAKGLEENTRVAIQLIETTCGILRTMNDLKSLPTGLKIHHDYLVGCGREISDNFAKWEKVR